MRHRRGAAGAALAFDGERPSGHDRAGAGLRWHRPSGAHGRGSDPRARAVAAGRTARAEIGTVDAVHSSPGVVHRGLCGLRALRETTLPFQCVSFLVVGVLVASDLQIPAVCVAALAIALGLFHGYADGSGIKDAGTSSGVLEFIGMMAALFVIVALISGLVVPLRRDWTRIVVRVAGSWIAAIGLLLLGWALHNS
jgi:hypothetical protein